MPYVDKARKQHVDMQLPALLNLKDKGELAYTLTRALNDYRYTHDGTNFATICDIMGAVECVKLEFYRRVVAPYEDAKRTSNGDVYAS